jgi:hypothetical protein
MKKTLSIFLTFAFFIFSFYSTEMNAAANNEEDEKKPYTVYPSLSESSVLSAREILSELTGESSYDVTINLRNCPLEELEEYLETQLTAKDKKLLGLKALLLESIQVAMNGNLGNLLSHIVIRVDPDTKRMTRNLQRSASSTWHTHGNSSLLFIIAEDQELATQTRFVRGGFEFHIPLFTLVKISGTTMHRTPPRKKGKRIQFSIAFQTQDETSTPEESKAKKQRTLKTDEDDSNGKTIIFLLPALSSFL